MFWGLKWSVSMPPTWVILTLWMLLSRSIFSATSAPVRLPGNATCEYLWNTDCRRACTIYPATAIMTMSSIEPDVEKPPPTNELS